MKPNSFYSSCGVGLSAIQTRHGLGSYLTRDLQPSPSCSICCGSLGVSTSSGVKEILETALKPQ